MCGWGGRKEGGLRKNAQREEREKRSNESEVDSRENSSRSLCRLAHHAPAPAPCATLPPDPLAAR